MDNQDDILNEIWDARRQIEQENHNDMEKLFQKYKEQQSKNPAEYYKGKPAMLTRSKAA
jgi:hypothetical protein